MRSAHARRAFAEFSVAALVCGGIYLFVVAPLEDKVHRVQAQADALAHPPEASASLNVSQLQSFTDQARAASARIATLSAPARDQTELFGRIMALASASGVRVESLQPTGDAASRRPNAPASGGLPDLSPPASPSPTGASTQARAKSADTCVGYTMVITAPYAGVAAFVRQLPASIGFAVVRGVKVEAGDTLSPGTVRAHIDTEHFAFDVSRLSALADGSEQRPANPAEGH